MIELTEEELRTARLWCGATMCLEELGKAGKTKVSSIAAPTVADVTLWIAYVGGYTGKTSSGGPPGSITISRGLKSVRAAAQAIEALASD